jgi:hypothetical protein
LFSSAILTFSFHTVEVVWPCAYFKAWSGPVMRLPMTHASTDQLV